MIIQIARTLNICSRNSTCSLLTNKQTPRSRVLSEKLTGSQLVKKFPTLYGTQTFITAFTTARYLPLSWARFTSCKLSKPIPYWHILILSSHVGLCGFSKWSVSVSFQHQSPGCVPPFANKRHMRHPSDYSWFYHVDNIWWELQIIQIFNVQISRSSLLPCPS
jgi:hypothetical protein